MSIFGLAFLARLWHRSNREKTSGHMLGRSSYIDETPIRVRDMAEAECLENGEHVDDEDLYSVSECSLEEIELDDNEVANNYREYLKSIRDGGYETYFDNVPDFRRISGPLISNSNEEQG